MQFALALDSTAARPPSADVLSTCLFPLRPRAHPPMSRPARQSAAARPLHTGARRGAAPLPGRCEQRWFDQRLDHFRWWPSGTATPPRGRASDAANPPAPAPGGAAGRAGGPGAGAAGAAPAQGLRGAPPPPLTWRQRYFVCDEAWRGPGAPIFIYAGNEGPVEGCAPRGRGDLGFRLCASLWGRGAAGAGPRCAGAPPGPNCLPAPLGRAPLCDPLAATSNLEVGVPHSPFV